MKKNPQKKGGSIRPSAPENKIRETVEDAISALVLPDKRFSKNDAGFRCGHCGFSVLPLGKTSRNHCPRCLYSLHVDVNPGDRAADCGGLMRPVSCTPDPQKGYIITHRCEVCGALRRNRAALKASARETLPDEQYDDTALLIRLTVPE